MMAMVLCIVMVNKPTMSNDRQQVLTSGKKTFARSFKWRLDMKWDNDFPESSWETPLLLPLLHQQERENARKKRREAQAEQCCWYLHAEKNDLKLLCISLPLASSFFSVLACPVSESVFLSSGFETSEKTQQARVAQSNPEKSLLAMAGAQLFPAAAPKATALPDTFMTTHKPKWSDSANH